MTESIEWDCVRSRVLKRTKQHTNRARRSNARECESGSGKGESEVKKSKKVLEKNKVKRLSGGLGTENLARRLALLFPDKHQYKSTIDDNRFIANVTIDLT